MIKLPASPTPPRGPQNSAADKTRAALVLAGLKLFGSQGFGATSTRQIAALAKANIGSIAYHFGGKDGLHAACADYIVETIQAIAGPALAEAASSIDDPESAKARLSVAIERMVSFLVARPEAGDIAQFVMREMARPSPALDRIYAGVFEPTHRQLCQIWQQATGEEPDSEATKITVFTLIGQIVYFRIAREAVMRRLEWAAIGPKEADAIADIVKGNLDAILTARRGPKP